MMSSSALIESERPPRSASAGAPRSTAVRAMGAKPWEAERRANIGFSGCSVGDYRDVFFERRSHVTIPQRSPVKERQ